MTATMIETGDNILISPDLTGMTNWAKSVVIKNNNKDVAPKGYLTGDEFESRCIANISKFYHEKGLL